MAKIVKGKIKVLVVDNDKDMSWLIARILKEEGFKVDITHSVESALEKIAKHPYHLIVLDYKLSGKSGLFVLDKTYQISPSIVTIMISAFGNAAVREKAKEFGAYAFLDKPFNIEGLKKTVKKALTEQRRRCTNETNLHKLHSRCSPNEHLSSSGFCSTGADSGSPKDRHPVHIGAG